MTDNQLDPTIRAHTIIHELGHAWIALQRGYAVTISIGVQGNSSGTLTTEPAMKPECHLTVLAAGFCAERVAGIPFKAAHAGAAQDVRIIFDCVGEETGLSLLNKMYQFFRDTADEFLAFAEQHRPALVAADTLRLGPGCLEEAGE